MKFRHLEYFVAAAEELNFTHAADRLHVSQPPFGYISALTHDFLDKALKVWRLTSPGIIIDCIEMDSVSLERALLEGICLAAFSIGRLRGTPQREQKAHVLYDSWHRRFCGWA
jgi:DNA-binding transcriptional LysR family regulator